MTVNLLAAVADALIAGALCFFLQRSRTGFKKYDLFFFARELPCLTYLEIGYNDYQTSEALSPPMWIPRFTDVIYRHCSRLALAS